MATISFSSTGVVSSNIMGYEHQQVQLTYPSPAEILLSTNADATAGSYSVDTLLPYGSNFNQPYGTAAGSSAPSYSISSAASINEGSALTVNVTTANVADATTLYWTVSNAGDFATSSGSFTITSNSGSFTVTPSADATTEGSETFEVSIRTGSTSGTVVATSSAITINDTRLTVGGGITARGVFAVFLFGNYN